MVLKVNEHHIFERRENDLHCTLPINLAQAVLGAEIEIETFDGTQQILVPEGTQPGRAIPDSQSGRADLE